MRIEWLYPGMQVKRWIALAVLGAILVAAGLFLMVCSFFPATRVVAEMIMLGVMAGHLAWLPGFALLLIGAAAAAYGARRAFYSLAGPFMSGNGALVDEIFARRYLEKGPRVVVIGGGTGIPVLLRGLKKYTRNLTAVVTVADDGGSSGRLRGELGILPPGDIRNCLVALAHREPLMEDMLQYRFSSGELKGHNMGNLLLAALCDITGGFDRAVRGFSRVLAVRGQVLPVTLSQVRLCAKMADGSIVRGESKISAGGGQIDRVFLEPANCLPNAEVLQAIREADSIVMGPGSLYTSILPNLLVPEVAAAISAAKAVKIYVCNVMTQPGETGGRSAAGHLKALLDHAGQHIVDYMVVNTEGISSRLSRRYRREGAVPVEADLDAVLALGVQPAPGRLVQKGDLVRHHPDKLAGLVMRLIGEHYPERVVSLNHYVRPGESGKGQRRAL